MWNIFYSLENKSFYCPIILKTRVLNTNQYSLNNNYYIYFIFKHFIVGFQTKEIDFPLFPIVITFTFKQK